MKELIIHDNEAGQRLDKLLRKYLSEAPGSFIYKMLRKKNIVLNGKKATGNEHLKKGDSVKLFLADDTIAKFQAAGKTVEESIKNTVKLDVIYEDQNVIFINKPSGMLSQKAKETDVSVVENVTAYLLESGQLTRENLKTFARRSATVWTGIPAVSWQQESLWRVFRCFPACLKTARSTSIISVSYPVRSGM